MLQDLYGAGAINHVAATKELDLAQEQSGLLGLSALDILRMSIALAPQEIHQAH